MNRPGWGTWLGARALVCAACCGVHYRRASHYCGRPRCNLDSHRGDNTAIAGRNDAAFDTTASRTQYPPAITEGGLPAGRWMTGAAAAHAQFPNPVPTSSSSTATKKEAAYTTARGLLISTTKISQSNAPNTSTLPTNNGSTVSPPMAHSVAQVSATRLSTLA